MRFPKVAYSLMKKLMLTRRRFLQVGLIGGGILLGARLFYSGFKQATPNAYRFLDRESADVIAAMMPVLLAGALPAEQPARSEVLRNVDKEIAGLPLAVQKELQELFTLLTATPLRWWYFGIGHNWSDATFEEINTLLESWRHSRFSLLRAAYRALHELVIAAWYANPLSWAQVGYRGPPALTN